MSPRVILDELENMRIPEVGTVLKGISALSGIVKDIRLKRKREILETSEPVRAVSTIYSVKSNGFYLSQTISMYSNEESNESTLAEVIPESFPKRKAPADVRRHLKKKKHE